MVATYDHDDLEAWMYITCPAAGTKSIYPDETQGNNIMVSVENDFIARTGLAITTSDSQHVQLCKWITELEYRKWSIVRHGAADTYSTPGGSVGHSNRGYTFTWEQFNELVNKIKGGSVASPNSAEMVDSSSGNELPTF
jgi:hypothetical protein